MTVLPAFASPSNILDPLDFVVGSSTVDGVETVTYDFNSGTPFLRFSDDLGNVRQGNVDLSAKYDVPAGVKTVYFFYYPFGNRVSPGNNLGDNWALDVRDILPGSEFTFDMTWSIDSDLQSKNVGSVDFKPEFNCLFFDSDGSYITVNTVSSSWLKSESYNQSGLYVQRMTYSAGFNMVVPDDVSFVVPYLSVSFVLSTASDVPTTITVFRDGTGISASSSINVFVKDSIAERELHKKLDGIGNKLDDVGDKLDGTNNKLDEIITGSPEQNEVVEDAKEDVLTQKQELAQALEELSELEQIDMADTHATLLSFMQSKSYLQVADLISPLTKWQFFSLIMLTVLALVNLSVVFFGR